MFKEYMLQTNLIGPGLRSPPVGCKVMHIQDKNIAFFLNICLRKTSQNTHSGNSDSKHT